MEPSRTVLVIGDQPALTERDGLRVLHRDQPPGMPMPHVGLALVDVPSDHRQTLVRTTKACPNARKVMLLPPGMPFQADLVGLCDAQVREPVTEIRWRSLAERHLGGHGLSKPPKGLEVPLPALSDSVQELLHLLDQPSTSIADAAEALQKDPALTANVLALVNSAYYGVPRGVSCLKEAAAHLGLRTLRLAVLTAYVFETLDHRAQRLRNRAQKRLRVARGLGTISDEAATASLLMDVGSLLLLEQHSDHVTRTADLAADERALEDSDRFGVDRDLLGAELLTRWRLPSSVVRGVAHGRVDFPDPSAGLIPEVVCWAAERILTCLEGGPAVDPGWLQTMGLNRQVASLKRSPLRAHHA